MMRTRRLRCASMHYVRWQRAFFVGCDSSSYQRDFGADYARDVAEVRAYVRYLAASEVDMVEVDSTIMDEQLKAVIDEGRRFGRGSRYRKMARRKAPKFRVTIRFT